MPVQEKSKGGAVISAIPDEADHDAVCFLQLFLPYIFCTPFTAIRDSRIAPIGRVNCASDNQIHPSRASSKYTLISPCHRKRAAE